MKKIHFAILLTLFVSTAFAQETAVVPAKNNEAGLELGGTGFAYSLYYGRTLLRSGTTSFSLRAGFAPYPVNFGGAGQPRETRLYYSVYAVPTVVFTRKHHTWEAGLGLSFIDFSDGEEIRSTFSGETYVYDGIKRFLYLAPQAGYRLYFAENRLYLRTSAICGIRLKQWGRYNHQDGPAVLPWGSVGIGFTF